MSLDEKSLLKKRQRKELKRNKKRKYLRAATNGGRIQALNEVQRYLKSKFLKAVAEGKIVRGPDGKYIAPALLTPTVTDVKNDSVTA